MKAEPASEQAIAIGDVHLVAWLAAGGANPARDQHRPGLDFAARVTDHGGLSRFPARACAARNSSLGARSIGADRSRVPYPCSDTALPPAKIRPFGYSHDRANSPEP